MRMLNHLLCKPNKTSSEDGKFHALPLEIHEETVKAILVIKDSSDQALKGKSYLEASNDFGSQKYYFHLISEEKSQDTEIPDRKLTGSVISGIGNLALLWQS